MHVRTEPSLESPQLSSHVIRGNAQVTFVPCLFKPRARSVCVWAVSMLTAIVAVVTAERQDHGVGESREALQQASPLQPVAGPQQSSQRRDAASPVAMKGFAASPIQMGPSSGARPAAPFRDPVLAGFVAQLASSSPGSSSSSGVSSSTSSSDPTGA